MTSVVERIHEVRVTRGVGLLEAKKIVIKQILLEDLEQATTIDDIKGIIRRIISEPHSR